jgi:hypothetical protein
MALDVSVISYNLHCATSQKNEGLRLWFSDISFDRRIKPKINLKKQTWGFGFYSAVHLRCCRQHMWVCHWVSLIFSCVYRKRIRGFVTPDSEVGKNEYKRKPADVSNPHLAKPRLAVFIRWRYFSLHVTVFTITCLYRPTQRCCRNAVTWVFVWFGKERRWKHNYSASSCRPLGPVIGPTS